MATQIKLRRDTGANWTANSTVVLAAGEIGVNLTSGEFKLGNGTSTWAQLTYFAPGSAAAGDSLVNGDSSFSMSSDGTLTLTHPAEPALHPLATVLTVQKAAGNYHTISGAYGLSLQATPVPSGYGLNTNTNFVDIFHDGVSVNVNDNTWAFGTGGDLTFPSGGKVIGDSQDGTYLQANPGNDGYAGLSSLNGNSWMWTANDGGAYISSSDGATVKSWSFNTDGKLTLPIGGDIVDNNGTTVLGGGNADLGNFTFSDDTISNDNGLILSTNRGTLAIGTQMETPGVAGHFHIGFNGSNSNPPASDLFLGDDNNYVKLPGYELNPTAQFGVEIGTDNRSLGPQNVVVDAVDELVPPGGVWRLFIIIEDYPNLGSLVSVGDTVTTSWGASITATVTGVVEAVGDGDWQIQVDQDITAGFSGYDTVSFGTPSDSYTWRFGTDGDLYFPPGKTIRDAMTGDDLLGGGSTSYTPDDTDNWNDPTINTISAALNELAARLTAIQNFEYDGGNANTPAAGELLIDGNGA